jgi:hypothetical protein
MTTPLTLTPGEFDAWHLASPLQLLHLMKRLGVESTTIAGWLGVTPAAVSQWNRGRRAIPLRYGPALLIWAQYTIDQAWKRNAKEVAAQPTEALQRATQAEFAALWTKWKLEVLHNAGTIQKMVQRNYQALGQWLGKDPLAEVDRASIAVVMETILRQVDLLLTLQGEAPRPEAEVIERLTRAHAAAQTTSPPAQA